MKCRCYYEEYGKKVCYGTKERDACSCGGDKTKCDFYPETRAKAIEEMNKESLESEYEFEVGDMVITSTGQIGVIDSICRCMSCVGRGFYEPSVTVLAGDDSIYITDTDKRVNFRSFYKIGKHVFGNIDIDGVKNSISFDIQMIDEATDRLKRHREQLHVLEKLKEREV